MVSAGQRAPYSIEGKEVRKGEVMTTQDTWSTLGAYLKVKSGKLEASEGLANRFVEGTRKESGIRFYGGSFNGEEVNRRHMLDIPRIKFFGQRRYRANWPFMDG
jgi:hypothetical protein